MALVSRIGNILKQVGRKHINIESSASSLSLYQAIRCMSSAKLFVGGLSYGTDETSLREAFAQYGEVIEARIIMDRETGRSRGFGFVSFTSSEEASSAIQSMDGQDLHGRRVRVNYATDKPSRGGFGGGYGGSGYGGGNYGGNYGGDGGYGRSNFGGGSYGGNYEGDGGYGRSSYGGGGINYGGGNGNYSGGGGADGSGVYGGSGNNYGGGDGNYGGGSGFGGGGGVVNNFDDGNNGGYGGGSNIGNDGIAGSGDNYSGDGALGSVSGFTDAEYGGTTVGTGGDNENLGVDPLEGNNRDDNDEPDDVVNTRV